VKIVQTTAIVSLGQFSNTFQRIALAFVLARVFSTYVYGTYQQVWLFYGLLSPLFILGIPGSLLYFIPQLERAKHKTLIIQSLLLLGSIGVLFGVATWISAAFVAQQFNSPELSLYLRIFSLYPLLALPATIFNMLLIASGRPVQSAAFSWIQSFLFVGFASIPALLGLPLTAILWTINGYALVLLIIVISASLWLYRGRAFAWDLRLLRSQLSYSIPLGLAGSLGTLSKQFDRAIVSFSLSPDQYAVYVSGALEIPFIGLITGSLMTVLIPEFVRRLKDGQATARVWRLWNRATEKTALLLFPLCIFLMIFSRDVMVLLYSEKYASSALVFAIYLMMLPMRIGQYGALLRAMGRSDLIFWISIIRLVAAVIVGVLFIRLLGLPGPAVAYVMLSYLSVLVYLFISCRLTRTSFARVMPWRGLARVMLLSIAAGVATIPAHLWISMPLMRFVIGAGSYFLLYVGLLLVLGVISLDARPYLVSVRRCIGLD